MTAVKSAQVLPLLKKAGFDWSLPTTGRYITYRQSPSLSIDLCWHVCVRTSPTPRTSASGSRPTGKYIRPRRHCSMSLTASTLRLTARKSHCLYRPRSLRSFRHGLSLDTDTAAAYRFLSAWDCTILDSDVSTGPDTVCEARTA